MLAIVDICNTIADVLSEIEKIVGPYGWNDYRHPRVTPALFERHPEIFWDALPYKGAVVGLHRLAERFEIIYLSARPEWARGATEDWLARHNFPAGELILTGDKPSIALRLGASVAIEDAPFEVRGYQKAGIPVLVKAQNYNKDFASRFDWSTSLKGGC